MLNPSENLITQESISSCLKQTGYSTIKSTWIKDWAHYCLQDTNKLARNSLCVLSSAVSVVVHFLDGYFTCTCTNTDLCLASIERETFKGENWQILWPFGNFFLQKEMWSTWFTVYVQAPLQYNTARSSIAGVSNPISLSMASPRKFTFHQFTKVW